MLCLSAVLHHLSCPSPCWSYSLGRPYYVFVPALLLLVGVRSPGSRGGSGLFGWPWPAPLRGRYAAEPKASQTAPCSSAPSWRWYPFNISLFCFRCSLARRSAGGAGRHPESRPRPRSPPPGVVLKQSTFFFAVAPSWGDLQKEQLSASWGKGNRFCKYKQIF